MNVEVTQLTLVAYVTYNSKTTALQESNTFFFYFNI